MTCAVGYLVVNNETNAGRSSQSALYKGVLRTSLKIVKQGLLYHTYQSLACETAINTDFSELFSLKRIYVKYKNAILSLIDCFVRT